MGGGTVPVRSAMLAGLLVISALALIAPGTPRAPVPGAATGPAPTIRIDTSAAAMPSEPVAPGPPYWLGGPTVPNPAIGLTPGLTVKPYGYYSGEPAPVGVGDFGVSSSGAAYTYNTTRFLGTAHLGSWNAGPANASSGNGNYTTLQLNVVVELTHGKSTAAYWIQDVPFYNTSSHYIVFEDNVWNFSGTSDRLPRGSVTGNGTIYGGTYYADGAGSGLAGNGISLTLPVNISAEVVASDVSGLPYVAFLYNDGYGWVTYDNVTFPWTKGWTLHGFEVNGSSYNPYGLFYDAEWIMGGPGGGSGIIDESSNFTMDLQYYNGHNFEAVPYAYDFGSDTAENTANVVASAAPSVAHFGAPGGRYVAGSGTLKPLYGSRNESVLNVSAVFPNATLLVNGSSLPYRGLEANVTLVPGSYHLVDTNGSPSVASKTVQVIAGEYDPVSFGRLALVPDSSLSDRPVEAEATSFTPGESLSILWGPKNTSLCSGTVPTNGSFSCSFSVPRTADGPYNVTAVEDDADEDSASATLLVLTNLTVSLSASRLATDAGGLVRFEANASLGFPPYPSYTWDFGRLASSVTSSGSANFTFAEAGDYLVNVTVEDQVGDLASAGVALEVFTAPGVSAPTPSRTSADAGQSASFSVTASGGSGGYTYAWSGLPSGCAPDGANASCPDLQAAGTYTVEVTINDTEGFTARSSPTDFRVYAEPTLQGLVNLQPYTDAGQDLLLSAEIDNGSGRYTFAWSGLPAGCATKTTTEEISCRAPEAGSLDVGVSATDSNGEVTGSADLTVPIYSDPTLLLNASSPGQADAGQSVTFYATVTGGSGGPSFIWTGLPPGCATQNLSSLRCLMSEEGPYTLHTFVTDRSGAQAEANLTYQVDPALRVGWAIPPPPSRDLGMTVELSAASSGGLPPYAYQWSGLPSGCASEDSATLNCTLGATGPFAINASVEDANGASVVTSSIALQVNALPSIAHIATSPATAMIGGSLSVSAEAAGGTGNLSYAWQGLPGGCGRPASATFTCTPTASGTFRVSLEVTDALGRSANGSVNVTVAPSLFGLPAAEADGLLGAIVVIAVAAVGALLWARRRRRPEGSGPWPEEPAPEPEASVEP